MVSLVAWIQTGRTACDPISFDVSGRCFSQGDSVNGVVPHFWIDGDVFDRCSDLCDCSVIDFANTKDSTVVFDPCDHRSDDATVEEDNPTEK
jgi:hypothetical protein